MKTTMNAAPSLEPDMNMNDAIGSIKADLRNAIPTAADVAPFRTKYARNHPAPRADRSPVIKDFTRP